MTEAVRKYRKDHPKCAYCLHIESKTDLSGANKFCWCRAKMKRSAAKASISTDRSAHATT